MQINTGVEIVEEARESIPLSEMQDGHIAVITAWDNACDDKSVGSIIQRFQDSLVQLGQHSDNGWPDRTALFSQSEKEPNRFRVRVLPAGTVIKIL